MRSVKADDVETVGAARPAQQYLAAPSVYAIGSVLALAMPAKVALFATFFVDKAGPPA